jgi:hypothetical protein
MVVVDLPGKRRRYKKQAWFCLPETHLFGWFD